MIRMGKRAEASAGLALLWLLAVGCDGCKEDKPYTPFGVTSAVPSAPEIPSAEPAPSAKPDPPKFAQAIVAPEGSRKLRMGERVLEAPARYVFDRALVLGEGDAQQAIAWVKAEPSALDVPRGLLMAYGASGKPKQLMSQPSFVPIAPGCVHATRLQQTGNASVLVDTVATCPAGLLARAPVEAVSIIAPESTRPEVLTLQLAAPAPGEALSVDADSTDRDGDGREDLKLTIALTAPDGAKASATLAFVDRAAGVSRDAAEPRTSLVTATKAILAKASPASTTDVDAVRRLLASLCAEGGTPRVFDGEGAPIRCGDLGPTIDNLGRAEVLSRLAARDWLGAVSVLSRSDWYFKKLSADAEKSITKELIKRLLAVAPVAKVLAARPKAAKGPHYSPLWFEPDGALLVQTEAGVVRVSRDGSTESALEADADAGAATAWPLDVTGSSGQRLTGALCVCDASEVALALTDATGAPQPPLPTRLLSPRPGGCKGRFTCPDPVPIGSTAEGFSLLLAGALIEPKKATKTLPNPGSARSPDGSFIVASTPLGLVVSGGSNAELWKLPEAPVEARRAQDCVVASDRAAVACVADGKALLFKRP